MFKGVQRRVIICPECGYELKMEDSFMNAGVMLGYGTKLKEARQKSLEDIKISGYTCDRCNSTITATQKTIIKKSKNIKPD